jgi:hypothetical protein
VYILKCEAFDDELSARYSNTCCKDGCHGTNTLIPVTPYALDATAENRRLDWELGIQGLVCCGRYEFVRSLSREWWVEKGLSVNLWSRLEADRLMHKGSWHKSYDSGSGRTDVGVARSVGVSVEAIKKVKTSAGKCPACGSKWNKEVCDNCGHGGGM